MDDPNQIEVPASFIALFASPSGRLIEPVSTIRDRYEHCEDLAQLLTEHASDLQSRTGQPEVELLRTIQRGLSGADAQLRAFEAEWVVRRLAEILHWPDPASN